MFDLYAKISLDSKEYEKNLGDAKSKFSGFADGIKGAVGKVGDVLAGIGKAATVGVGAAGAALTSLTKKTLDAVGSFEQLEGGAQKIFDEMDFSIITKDAQNAYKELNMSASEYLESINLAGATFAQTMGDEEGYNTARKGMLAIADYASGTGRSLSELNEKYQMITRATSSYQSIADQFSGILPATSNDFLEQAKAAGYLSETYEALTEVPVAEYQQALTNMLEKGVEKLGLSNNTLRESTETLTGSFAMAKAAWKNFLTGQGTTDIFVDTLKSAIEQTTEKLDEIIPRITDGLEEMTDLLAPEIPPIIERTLPSIIKGSSSLITGLANKLPDLLETTLPALSQGVIDVSVALVGVMPELITSLKKSIPIVVNTIMEKKDDLLQAGKDMIAAIFPSEISGDSLKKIVDSGFNIVGKLVENITSEKTLDQITNPDGATVKIIGAIGEGLVEFAINLVDSAREVIKNLGDYLNDEENRKQLFESAKEILVKIGKGLTSQEAKDAVGGLIVESAKFLADVFIGGIDWDATGGQIAEQIVSGIYNNLWTTRLGTMLGEALSDATHGMELDYLEEGAGTYSDYRQNRIDEGNRAAYDAVVHFDPSQLTGAARDAYNASRHATGFYANRPTWLSNSIVGESGDEVLLPLDSNTEWMDKLADKLGNKMNGGIYITVNAPTGNADDIVDAIDVALRNRQLAQARSTGGTGWK